MMPLGHRLTWRRKPRGTTACRESGERPKTCRARPCKTRVIWRKLDCLTPQSPGMQKNILRHHVWERSCRIRAVVVKLSESPSGGRWPVRSLKGTNGAPKSRSIRRSVRESGIAYGARALWRRSLRSTPLSGWISEEPLLSSTSACETCHRRSQMGPQGFDVSFGLIIRASVELD